MPPERLGPYRLERRIGRGGMGTVFAARNEVTGELAAVKVLSPGYIAGVEGFPDRFAGEIESLKLLRHPNIVQILGYGEDGDYRYYAMELVDGASLQEALDSGRTFAWPEAARLAQQICRALKHAHDRGVVHRDLKPANLLLSANDTVKLSDFGIAKLFGHTGLTSDGGVVGTAEYMSPEQADSRQATARSDLYSLGGVVYAMLAGRPPFRAKSVVDMLQLQRFAEPEPIGRVRSGLPAELSDLVAQLLQKDPANRPASAMIVARQLENVLSPASAGPTARPAAQGSAIDAESATHDGTSGGANESAAQAGPAATMDFQLAPDNDSVRGGRSDAPAIPRRPPSRMYTSVEANDIGRDAEPAAWKSPGVWLLAAALLGMVGLAWYWLLPPSADRLYSEISAASADGDTGALAAAEPKLRDFLNRFPNDARVNEVREFLEAVELDQLEQRFEFRAKSSTTRQSLTAIEQAYLEAMAYARLEPARGRKKMQAIVDLFGNSGDDSKQTRDCLQLARKQLERLTRQEAAVDGDLDALVTKQLDAADRLEATDAGTAGDIRRAVVELYAEEPWAAAAVGRARKALSRTTP